MVGTKMKAALNWHPSNSHALWASGARLILEPNRLGVQPGLPALGASYYDLDQLLHEAHWVQCPGSTILLETQENILISFKIRRGKE